MFSLSNKKWVFSEVANHRVLAVCQKFAISDILARIMLARGIEFDEIADFLEPTLKKLMWDPYGFNDMEAGVERVVEAIVKREKITIYGDYDVDGASSTALLAEYFKLLKVKFDYYIPDRLAEGYGVNASAIQNIRKRGADLLIMVDCGTTSIEEMHLAKELGLECVIIDHHKTGVKLPSAVAVINPQRLDQKIIEGMKYLSAAGIVFFFLTALQRKLKSLNFFDNNSCDVPNLMDFCDLVALGTVCDVMVLRGINRAFVKRGLELIRNRGRSGLRALIDIASLNEKITAYSLGFAIGPRINAAGRIGKSTLGTELLIMDDEMQAKELAYSLNKLNVERQLLEKEILEESIKKIECNGIQHMPILFVGSENWHPGIIGIVSSRLKERYNKPSFVFSIENGIAKGSGRSVEGIDIGSLVHKAKEQQLLVGGGGHNMAAGFSVDCKKLSEFQNFLNESTKDFMQMYQPELKVEANLSLRGANIELLNELEKLEPFGVGNPSPKFCFNHVYPGGTRIVGEKHLQCFLKDESGYSVKAVAFGTQGTKLGDALQSGKKLSIVGTVKKNNWNQKSEVQIIIEDAAL